LTRHPQTLDAWLDHIERLHHRPIDLGLERVRAVADRMGLARPTRSFVVGGTNGKGSTCAMLDAILRAAGYRVGVYSSPHLLHFRERARVDGAAPGDEELIRQFAIVEQARADTTLTYFEFTTLAILAWFAWRQVDVAVLEIGLGGRLDAVNIVDADCSIVTSVDLDHMELLGPDRAAIGWEKAHIFRAGRPAICGDPDPPASLVEFARDIGADLWRIGADFLVQAPAAGSGNGRQWSYRGRNEHRVALPFPALRGGHQLRNAAAALAALEAVGELLPADQSAVRKGLTSVQLPGRFQVNPGRPVVILDVAHNPHAARALAQALRSHADLERSAGSAPGSTRAVFGMLRDKDAPGVVQALRAQVDHWYLVPTQGQRGQTAQALAQNAFQAPAQQADRGPSKQPDASVRTFPAAFDSMPAALDAALGDSGPDDRIVVLGSFVVVADAMRCLERKSR